MKGNCNVNIWIIRLLNYCLPEDQEQGFLIMEYLCSDLEK